MYDTSDQRLGYFANVLHGERDGATIVNALVALANEAYAKGQTEGAEQELARHEEELAQQEEADRQHAKDLKKEKVR